MSGWTLARVVKYGVVGTIIFFASKSFFRKYKPDPKMNQFIREIDMIEK